jgi:hypothetical protein
LEFVAGQQACIREEIVNTHVALAALLTIVRRIDAALSGSVAEILHG